MDPKLTCPFCKQPCPPIQMSDGGSNYCPDCGCCIGLGHICLDEKPVKGSPGPFLCQVCHPSDPVDFEDSSSSSWSMGNSSDEVTCAMCGGSDDMLSCGTCLSAYICTSCLEKNPHEHECYRLGD